MKNVLFLMMALTLVSAPAVMGEEIKTDAPAYQSKGTVMVPMRAIFEWLGAEVSFDSATGGITAKRGEQAVGMITAKRGEQVVSLKAGSKTATVNGEKRKMPTPVASINGRIFVPARFVAETLDAEVAWDKSTHTVRIVADQTVGTMSVERQASSAKDRAAKTPRVKHVRVSDGQGGYWDFRGTCDPGMIKNIDTSTIGSEITVKNRNGDWEGTWKRAGNAKN